MIGYEVHRAFDETNDEEKIIKYVSKNPMCRVKRRVSLRQKKKKKRSCLPPKISLFLLW